MPDQNADGREEAQQLQPDQTLSGGTTLDQVHASGLASVPETVIVIRAKTPAMHVSASGEAPQGVDGGPSPATMGVFAMTGRSFGALAWHGPPEDGPLTGRYALSV